MLVANGIIEEPIVIDMAKTFTLDLGGETLTTETNAFIMEAGADMTVGGGTIVAANGTAFQLKDGATLTLNDVTVEANVGVDVTGGTLTVNDAAVVTATDKALYLQGGDVVINGGKLASDSGYALYETNVNSLYISPYASFNGKVDLVKFENVVKVGPTCYMSLQDAIAGIKSAYDAGIGKIIAIASLEPVEFYQKISAVEKIIKNFDEFDRSILEIPVKI